MAYRQKHAGIRFNYFPFWVKKSRVASLFLIGLICFPNQRFLIPHSIIRSDLISMGLGKSNSYSRMGSKTCLIRTPSHISNTPFLVGAAFFVSYLRAFHCSQASMRPSTTEIPNSDVNTFLHITCQLFFISETSLLQLRFHRNSSA